MRHFLFVLLFIFFSTLYADKKLYNAQGFMDCGDFLKFCDIDLKHSGCYSQATFGSGFITGMNYQSLSINKAIGTNWATKVGEDKSINSVKYAMIKYCKDKPLNSTVDAILYIYFDLLLKEKK